MDSGEKHKVKIILTIYLLQIRAVHQSIARSIDVFTSTNEILFLYVSPCERSEQNEMFPRPLPRFPALSRSRGHNKSYTLPADFFLAIVLFTADTWKLKLYFFLSFMESRFKMYSVLLILRDCNFLILIKFIYLQVYFIVSVLFRLR